MSKLNYQSMSCPDCGECEPYDWNYTDNGLWTCSCPSPEPIRSDELNRVLSQLESMGERT